MIYQPIDDPEFWKERLANARKLSHSVFLCTDDEWITSQKKQRQILSEVIHPTTSVLDAGCAYGRMLDLMPPMWGGDYVGIDLSEDFIELARHTYPTREFIVGRIDQCEKLVKRQYDVAIAISIKGMVVRNNGDSAWQKIEDSLYRVADKVCIIEY